MADVLTTKARIKDRLSITTTGFDDLFDNLIVAVTKRISQMCNGRIFNEDTYTNELHDGSDLYGSPRFALIIKHAPIQTLTSVQYKAGLNSNPSWTSFTENDYDLDETAGILYFNGPLPIGKQNIRVTYTGGFNGYTLGLSPWIFNVIPTGAVNGSNRVYILPQDASELVVYADGIRVLASNYTFTTGTNTFTMDVGQEAHTAIAVDYLPAGASSGTGNTLPADLVEVAEEAVVRLFKRRDSEGRQSESFNESSITWTSDIFSKENLATIKNYRRGYTI